MREAKDSCAASVADFGGFWAGAESVEQGLKETEETDEDRFGQNGAVEVAREFFAFQIEVKANNRDEEAGENDKSEDGAGFVARD